MNDPAASTMMRFQPGCLRNDRGSSAGSTSSSSVIPTILLNPPAGIALMPYSVSPLLRGPDRRPEADEELGDLHAEHLGRDEVPPLVQHDRDEQRHDEDGDAQQEAHPATLPSSMPRPPRDARGAPRWQPVLTARARAHRSAARTSARVTASPARPIGFRDYLRHGVHDPGEREPAGHEGGHAHLVGGVVDGGRGPARLPGGAGDARPRETPPRRAARRSRCARSDQSMAGAAPGTRSGQPSASAIGIRMSGGLAWAIVDPSVNSTIEWMTDCGWTTTEILSNPSPNSRWASMTSSPLLTSVAELIVMTGPMFQVGWASACSGVMPSSSARLRPRNGPPLAVSTSRATSPALPAAQALRDRGVLGVDGNDLAGRGQPGDQRPAHDQGLLVRQREHPAGLERGERGGEPAEPGHRVQHHVGRPGRDLGHGVRARQHRWAAARLLALAGPAGERRQGVPHLTGGRFPVHGHHRAPNSSAWAASRPGLPPPAASATTRNRPGLRRITSAAWVPTEPVEPSSTTSRGREREDSTKPFCPLRSRGMRQPPPTAPLPGGGPGLPTFVVPGPASCIDGACAMCPAAPGLTAARPRCDSYPTRATAASQSGRSGMWDVPSASSRTPRIWCSSTTLRSNPSREPAM